MSELHHICHTFTAVYSVTLPAGSARITYITPRRGSIAGGTKVTAYGSGFATDAYTSSNFVFLGSVPCLVQP